MSGVRARRVRRNKALMAMYCPNGAFHGPQMPFPVALAWYYGNVVKAIFESLDLSPFAQWFKPLAGSRPVTFPVEVA